MTFLEIIKNLFILLFMTMLLSGCGGIKFNPDIHVGDYENQGIVNERGEIIYCDSPEFNAYGAMHITKWQELREILIRARMSRRKKNYLIHKYDKHTKVLKK